jgi:hypothetical protein
MFVDQREAKPKNSKSLKFTIANPLNRDRLLPATLSTSQAAARVVAAYWPPVPLASAVTAYEALYWYLFSFSSLLFSNLIRELNEIQNCKSVNK